MNRFVDFLAMNGNILGGDDPEANFVAPNLDDRDRDVAIDHDAFIFFFWTARAWLCILLQVRNGGKVKVEDPSDSVGSLPSHCKN